MEHTNTYKMLLKTISKKKAVGLTQAYIEDMKYKLDIFLTGDRITQEEYEELVKLLDNQVVMDIEEITFEYVQSLLETIEKQAKIIGTQAVNIRKLHRLLLVHHIMFEGEENENYGKIF